MPSTPAGAPARSAAELNARIRELWAHGRLPDERRPEYEALLVAWAQAVEAEREATAEAA
ncbi:hypothetical protein ACWEFL_15675 [Streptomyces sp. NPDC004838]